MIIPNPTASEPATVSVVIPTFNCAESLQRTLASIRWADEIVAVDMFSSDNTEAVCRSYPQTRFFQRKDYIYGNVNFGSEQATSDWIIRLDSDEILSPELQASIRAFLTAPPSDVSGCIFPSVQFMFGRPMHFGPGLGGPPRRCMFRRGTARYNVISEHEDFTSTRPGRWVTLVGHYDHHTNATVREAVTKYIYYAERDAERRDRGRKTPGPMRILWQGLRLFWFFYVTQKGYKEGVFGFYTSLFRGPVQHWIMCAQNWHVTNLSDTSSRDH